MKIFCSGINEGDLKIRPGESQSLRLSRWANMFGNFKITYSFIKKGEHIFTKHVSILKCLENEWGIQLLEKANHRQILPIELVLDLDNKPTLQKLHRICDDLDNLECIYYAYFTGSKGYHVHIFDYEFIGEHWRDEIKKVLIDLWGCDLLKYSDNVMIAMENQPHWKTGIKKELIRYGKDC